MHLGLSYEETLDMPFPRLMDLIAVDQIKVDGYKPKLSPEQEQDELMRMLEVR